VIVKIWKKLNLEVIDLDTDDDCDVEINSRGTSLPTVFEKINLNSITYIQLNCKIYFFRDTIGRFTQN
jgi:hypothetical protein